MNEPLEIEFSKPEKHPKAWGEELWIDNNYEYCGKVLKFNKGSSFSMHFHLDKRETWFLSKGNLQCEYFDLSNAETKTQILVEGSVVKIPRGHPHKLTALEDSIVFEVSTTHSEHDSYRIGKGDSQK
jgi:mannose-6-phosphate isomerase-like protein (cupin superfamily)|tara:strand:- start:39 stop:419 length:381 start_codon:yes stop_codon:yes gene_type:complete